MRIFSILLVSVFLFGVLPQPSMAAGSESIAIVVNDGVITKSDVDERMRLIMVSSGLPNRPDIIQNLAPQVMGALVDEQIRLQEAERLELMISQNEIDEGFATIAQSNNFTPEQFREVVKRSGINISTLEDQIRAQLAWTKVAQSQLRPQVNITERDVDNMLERYQNSLGKSEYLTAEIFLPVDDVNEEQNIRMLAQKLVGEIRAGKAPFSKIAQQFSKSAGSSQGGDLGWVQDGQLAQELDQVLRGMEKGTVSDPIRGLSGYHILLLRDQRVLSEETIPSRQEVYNILGQQRLESLARRYFLDLKSAAFVDNRLGS